MKPILIPIILLTAVINSFAQIKCSPKFQQLIVFSKKHVITNDDFLASLAIVKNLESNNCLDYVVKKNGEETVISGRTYLFGEICLKNNSRHAVKEYVNYIKRHRGSAEEQISFSFERLFVNRPEDVLSVIGLNNFFLDHLVWGYLNNHDNLHPQNYKEMFFRINPKAKALYPKYKKHIDYLLKEIAAQLKV